MVVNNKDGSFDLSLDFLGSSINTTISPDKRVPPAFTDLKNSELAQVGRFQKRFGISDSSTNASPDIPETAVNAVVPGLLSDLGNLVNQVLVAVGDDAFYWQFQKASAWASIGAAQTAADTYPYRVAWGFDEASDPVVYFANNESNTGPGVFAIDAINGTLTKIGSDSDGSNPWDDGDAVEYFLDKLWVGKVDANTDRLYWSVTGDHNDFYSDGSGFINLRNPGGGSGTASLGITALRRYRNRLYIGSASTLSVITGTTSNTFGSSFIRPQNAVAGATMFVAGDFLFFADHDGIWQFNGTTAANITRNTMKESPK